MSHKTRTIALVILSLTLIGCGARGVVPQPGKITLENAMRDVGEGLLALREAQRNLRTGLIADDVTVVFNVSASGTDTNKLYVEATPLIAAQPLGKAGTEITREYHAARGNQITIKMKNIMTADTSHITGKDNNIENIKELVEFIKSEGRSDLGIRDRRTLRSSTPGQQPLESYEQTQTSPVKEERAISGSILSPVFDPIKPTPKKPVTK